MFLTCLSTLKEMMALIFHFFTRFISLFRFGLFQGSLAECCSLMMQRCLYLFRIFTLAISLSVSRFSLSSAVSNDLANSSVFTLMSPYDLSDRS